jgi:uncharacterized cupredoxin-like copper-binding protein
MTRQRLAVLSFLACAAALAVTAVAPAQHQVTRTTVLVTAGKPGFFSFTVSKKSVPKGIVTFKVTNKGALGHDFKVCASNKGGTANACAGRGTALISPGRTVTLTITFLRTGTYEYLCTVSGHAKAGMKGTLKVT